MVGRYGGEEFVILLPETDAPAAGHIAERIRSAVACQVIAIEQHRLTVTISQGVATTQGISLDLAALLTQADQALYEAKHAGRNCIRLKQQ